MVLLMLRSKSIVLEAAVIASFALLCSCSSGSAEKEPVRTYQMGERAVVAPFTYAVYEKQWLAQLGTGPEARLPQNRFLLVRISATNGGGAEAYVPNLALEDDAGNTCSEANNGDAVPHWIGYLRSIKPADTLQGDILFDCAPKHYRLKLANEEGKYAYVDIPLSFESEGPSVEIPTKEKSVSPTHSK
jgi:hypothetical protein